jgi:hypothetical protein
MEEGRKERKKETNKQTNKQSFSLLVGSSMSDADLGAPSKG